MIITRESQLLLNFFDLRVVINGNTIYQLDKGKSIVIPLSTDRPQIVVTDGFHCTKSLEVVYHHINISYLKVVCAIDDNLIAVGSMLLTLFYLVGLTSGIVFIQLLSFVPIIYFLYCFYINRKDYIQIKQDYSV